MPLPFDSFGLFPSVVLIVRGDSFGGLWRHWGGVSLFEVLVVSGGWKTSLAGPSDGVGQSVEEILLFCVVMFDIEVQKRVTWSKESLSIWGLCSKKIDKLRKKERSLG